MIFENTNSYYEIPKLEVQVKKIWTSSHKWRLRNKNIEWSLPSTYGDVWFPLYRAPINVEKFVKAWYQMDGDTKG